ncbi:EAL domain-containing protein [Deltaproteobacteria bacterium TL4]
MEKKIKTVDPLSNPQSALDVANFFKSTRLCENLSEEQLQGIAQLAVVETYQEKEVILKEGLLNSKLFFVTAGTVRVVFDNEYLYSLKRRGDIFGEGSVITKGPCTESIVAETSVVLLVIEREKFQTTPNAQRLEAVFFQMISTILFEKLRMTSSKAGLLEKSQRDPITQCYNQNRLFEDLKKHNTGTLICLKIDKFNEINDGLGFEAGNTVLEKTAKLVREVLPKSALLYRFSGAEFAVLLFDSHIKNLEIANRIRRYLSISNISFKNSQIAVSLSIGLAHQEDTGDLFKQAHIALGEAKRVKRVIVYSDDIQAQTENLKNLQQFQMVRTAFENNNFFPVFQGIRDNRKNLSTYGKLLKYECLIRLKAPDHRILSPHFFLNALNRSGEMTRATKLMLMKSCTYMTKFDYEFSINITESDLLDPSMFPFIQYQLEGHEISPDRVTFEILEGVSSLGDKEVRSLLMSLRKLGCKIAIDDFGSEQSNISRLLDFAPDYIKIDAKFIKNLPNDKNCRILVENVFDLATRMGAEVVAEFVANEEIQKIVEEIGIHFSQGYLFSEPQPNILLET